MKIEMEVTKLGDNPPSYKGVIKTNGIEETTSWSAGPEVISNAKAKGINMDYLAAYNIGKQLLTDAFRTRFYPPGDVLKTPAARVAGRQEIEGGELITPKK